MKIIDNTITFIAALIGLIGGAIWAYKSDLDYEPVILTSVSALTILGFILAQLFSDKNNSKDKSTKQSEPIQNNKQKANNTQNVSVKVNVGNQIENGTPSKVASNSERLSIIEAQKPKTHILFIDDDTKFNTVKILKDSGWKNTKTVKDVKSIDLPIVQNADIVFVDINGVGKLLGLEFEGLDLAYMIKQKYPEKKDVRAVFVSFEHKEKI